MIADASVSVTCQFDGEKKRAGSDGGTSAAAQWAGSSTAMAARMAARIIGGNTPCNNLLRVPMQLGREGEPDVGRRALAVLAAAIYLVETF